MIRSKIRNRFLLQQEDMENSRAIGKVRIDIMIFYYKKRLIMQKYTDDDIRNMNKITCKIAADYLRISPMAVSIGMRNNLLPIGFAIHNEERDRTYSESWSYHIVGERLIAYKYGKTSEVQVQNIEKSLNIIIEQFEEMKKDLVFLLSENDNLQN